MPQAVLVKESCVLQFGRHSVPTRMEPQYAGGAWAQLSPHFGYVHPRFDFSKLDNRRVVSGPRFLHCVRFTGQVSSERAEAAILAEHGVPGWFGDMAIYESNLPAMKRTSPIVVLGSRIWNGCGYVYPYLASVAGKDCIFADDGPWSTDYLFLAVFPF